MIFRFNFYLASVIIFAIISSYSSNKIRFTSFKSRHELEESNIELKKTEAKLIEASKNKDIFMANISHELRTPLNLILLPLKLLLNNKYGMISEKSKDILLTINKNGLILLKLINNLLDLSKLEVGKMRLNVKSVEAVNFCKNLIESALPTMEERGLSFEFKHVPQSTNIMIDPELFEKVLLNLISNAIKFTPEGGKITLSVDETESHVMFTVMDTGLGIPKDMHETVFNRFSQVDGTSSRKHDGTGIGLSLVKEIVELHGGSVELESEPFHGSSFIIKILKGEEHITEEIKERRTAEKPVDMKKRAEDYARVKISDIVPDNRQFQLIDLAKSPAPNFSSIEAANHEFTLIVIDDNPDLLKLMDMILKDEYNILLTQSAEEGLKIMMDKKPDLAVCDVMMPGMDGYAFCRYVKSDENLKHIPVILVTALVETNNLVEGVDSGADDYLTKPFDPLVLMARIRSLLRMRKIEADLAIANQNLRVRANDLIERQETLFHSIVKSLVSTIDAKDEYTRNHSMKVTEYCLAIADRMGFSDREKKDIELASLLHDVGKIAVPEAILLKESSLTDEEFAYIKTHPIRGEAIVKEVVELKNVASLVRSHHERYDGKGYPDGLDKHNIPIGARIMSVADSYDAMTSNRSYRKSLSHQSAVKEIVKNSGTQFDPEVVEHFLALADVFDYIKSGTVH